MVFVFVNTVMSQFVKFLDLLYLLGLVLIIYSVVTSDFLLYFACVCLLYACLKVLRKQTTGQIPVQGQGVYITGCDTGKISLYCFNQKFADPRLSSSLRIFSVTLFQICISDVLGLFCRTQLM